MKIRENVPISELTTMRLGGEARYVVEVENKRQVKTVIDWAEQVEGAFDALVGEDERGERKVIKSDQKLPWFIMGGGANTIGRDTGFPGVILLMKNRGIDIIDATDEDVMVWAEAGENWDDFVKFTVEHNLSGIECLSKIPGTVGAAPVQNIGAYGQDVAETIDHVEAYDTATHEFIIIGRGEMEMSYRETMFNTGAKAGRYVITGAAFLLSDASFEALRPPFYNSLQKYLDQNFAELVRAGDTTKNNRTELASLREKYDKNGYPPEVLYKAVSAIRGDKLPDPSDKASAGSFFKNVCFNSSDQEALALAKASGCKIYDKPDGRKMINAGALIEAAGLKGKLLHGMRVSDKAALVLINEHAKSYADLAAARAEIIKTVRKKFGFEISQEPVEILA